MRRAKLEQDDPIKEFCNCAKAKPVDVLTNGGISGIKIAEQCGLCLRPYKIKCYECGAWLKDMSAHLAFAHKKPPAKRARRETYTQIEAYIAGKTTK